MWMKIDDRLHTHRKTRAVLRSSGKIRDAAPMGLWVLAGSWSAQNDTDGWVPTDELERFDDDWEALVRRLVAADFWWPEKRDGEDGYGFVDWTEWNTTRERQSADGKFGNHKRWHVDRGMVKSGCEFCPQEPDSPPDSVPDIAPESGGDRGGESEIIALPDPTRPVPDPIPKSVSSANADASADPPTRDDVERICNHLADRIEANGSKRPGITKRWRTAARLMLDQDGRTETEVLGAIDWCQADEFWRSNILSLPKLREKYDQLRLHAQRARAAPASRRQAETDDLFARAAARMGVTQP